jgi:hypothetical protein
MPEEIGDQDSSETLAASILDIALMVLTTGRERTLTEYERLFAGAGLKLGEVTRIPREPMLYHTIQALPA